MSLVGGNFSPYRLPAGGVPWWCSQPAHANGDVLETKYLWNATVPNPAGGSSIAPFERFQDNSADDTCEDNGCNTGTVCEPWIGVDTAATTEQYTMVAGQVNTAPISFAAASPAADVNFAVCHKRGFKGIAARRWWHGRFGMNQSGDNQICLTTGTDGSGNPTYTWRTYRAYDSAAPQTKYLTMDLNIQDVLTCACTPPPGPFTPFTHTWHNNVSVNPNSGEQTLNECSLYNSSIDTSSVPELHLFGSIGDIVDFFTPPETTGGGAYTISATNTTLTITETSTGNIQWEYVCDPGSGTFSKSEYGGISQDCIGGPDEANVWGVVNSWTVTGLSDTGYTYTYTHQGSPPDVKYTETVTVTVTLSSTSTNNGGSSSNYDVSADIVGLLSYWPLNDDVLHPWRTDDNVAILPKMSRLELDGNVAPSIGLLPCTLNDYSQPQNGDGSWPQRDWIDLTCWSWRGTEGSASLVHMIDGSIQGIPLTAGYQGYFRYDAVDWRGCCYTEPETMMTGIVWYIYGYGQFVPSFLPTNCTQWNSNNDALAMVSNGAVIRYASPVPNAPSGCASTPLNSDNAFWMVKWAECGETYQSYNFARPGGADKFLIDETQTNVFCYDGTTLTDYNDNPVTNALSGIWGGPCVGGFFSGCSASGGTLTLGTKVYNVPSDWSTPGNADNSTVFGQLRFAAAPGILGRAMVTAVADASSKAPFSTGWTPTYQFPSAQTSFGMAAAGTETLDFYDINMTSLATSVTVTRDSDTQFHYAGATYSTLFWVQVHGAPGYQWDDTYPKGDFVHLEWTSDFRTNGEASRLDGITDCSGNTPPTGTPAANTGYNAFAQTQDALPIIRCHPRVACYTPNGETFPNGKTYAFPTVDLDELYGTLWQGQLQWSMTDPLYQTPHRPCGLDNTIAWKQDDGTCPANNDTAEYYPFAPAYEARLTVPTGAPAMPTGIALGWISPVTSTTGDVALPPGPNGVDTSGNPIQPLTPWWYAMTLCNEVTGGCRFNYQNWLIC